MSLHNLLYKFEKNQRFTLNILGLFFIVLSIVWLFFEIYEVNFPMEPLVVCIGGIATLLATYWPWKPTYKSQCLHGRVSFDYENSNNRQFEIGRGLLSFTLKFSKSSDVNIHIYRDPDDIESISLTPASSFAEIKDVSAMNFENRAVTVSESQIAALKNIHGSYALIQIHDIKDASRADEIDEVTFSYVINPIGKTDFSWVK